MKPQDQNFSPKRMLAAAWMVTAVFILSNAPTPLYVYWQQNFGFSSGTLTTIFSAYILGLLVTLLIAGQLSDRFGRRPVLIPGLLLAIFAAVLFATAGNITTLVIARLLTGIAIGVIVSAGMASVVDMGGTTRKRQSSLAASVAMVLGAGLGPLLSGVLAHIFTHPVPIIFLTECILLTSALFVALFIIDKPAQTSSSIPKNTHKRSFFPSIPAVNRIHLLLGIAVFAPGITSTSFVLCLGPSLLVKLMDINNPLIAGSMACAMFFTATGVQFMVKQLSVRSILILGSLAIIIAMISLMIAIHTLMPILLIIAALLAGAGQGLGQLGGLTLIGTHVPDDRRAQGNALLNIGGYVPAGLLPLVTGFLIDILGLESGANLFAIIILIAACSGVMFVTFQLRNSLLQKSF
jgi:MFS family permease